MNEAAVQAEYERLDYARGWAFAMTPLAWLPTAEVVLVGLNPGGADGEHDKTDACWENLDGNAYFNGRWVKGNPNALYPIQQQVIALHAFLDRGLDEVFAAQFIPFRSPRLVDLKHREEAISFARELWSWTLKQSPAKLFFCMGNFAAWHIADLLGARFEGKWASGWGTTQVRRYVSPDGRVVVSLPHPSRYLLFSMQGEKREIAHHAIREASRAAPL